MANDDEVERHDEDQEGGPVKTFLEHLEDLRWVLIKSGVSLFVAMVVCLAGASQVMALLKWPLERAKARHPGTNQIVSVSFGTNRIGTFALTDEQQQALALGSN